MATSDSPNTDSSHVAALAALHAADRAELTQLDVQLITIAGIMSVYCSASKVSLTGWENVLNPSDVWDGSLECVS